MIAVRVVVGVLGFAAVAAQPPAQKPPEPTIAQLVADLGSPEFPTRERAEEELWKRGEAAVPALEKAAADPDPERSRRARDVLDKLTWGISPDTPADVVALIRRFQAGGDRRAALDALLDKGKAGRKVVRLILTKDIPPPARAAVVADVNALLRAKVPLALFAEDAAAAAELFALHTGAPTPAGAADAAAFHVLTNTLPAAIARAEADLKTTRDPAAARILLAHLYRANRDWAKARAAAADYPQSNDEKQSNVGTAVERLHEEEGNWSALLETPFAGANMPEALDLALLRLAGKTKEFEAAAQRVRESADGSGVRDAIRDAAHALLLNNKAAEATDFLLANRHQLGLLADVLIARMRYKEALELVEPGKGDPLPPGERLDFDLRRARLLVLTGRRADGVQLFGQVAEGFRVQDGPQDRDTLMRSRRSVLRAELRGGLRELAAEHAALFLTADGSTGPDPDAQNGESLFEVLFGADAVAAETLYWAMRAKKIPGDAAGGTMKRVRELIAGTAPRDAVDEAVKLIESLPPEFEPQVEEARPGRAKPPEPVVSEVANINRLFAVAAVCRAAKRDAQAEKALNAAAEKAKERPNVTGPRSWVFGLSDASRPWIELGDFLSDRDRFRDAAAKFEAGWRRFPDQPLLLFLSGRALVKAGDAKEGRRRMELSHWVSLGSEKIRGQFLDELVRRGEAAAARRETDLMLRVCWARDYRYGNVVNQAARASALCKDFATAEVCVQRSLLVLMRSPGLYFVENSAYLSVPHEMQMHRARARLAAGKVDEAVAQIRGILAITPGHVDFVTAVVPELEKAGRKAEADEVYGAARSAYRKMMSDYPDSAAARGALAALAAHCRRDLGEALGYAKEAVAADPLSLGYRETLAEVQFRRGDRDAALSIMTKLADETPRSRLYRRQLTRYKSAAFDSPWPEAEPE